MDKTKHNVILLTIDCFRYDRCGFNGYTRSTTPFLDSLATESYVFDNAFATGPYTPESFPGILAGIHAKDEYYSQDLTCKAIPANAPTLAGHLAQNGYETVATVSNTHLSENRNFDKGFNEFQNIRIEQSSSMEERRSNHESSSLLGSVSDSYQQLMYYLRDKMSEKSNYPNLYLPLLLLQRFRLLSDWPTVDAEQVSKTFVNQLAQISSEDPFFGWMHLMDLHAPLHPDKYRDSNGRGIEGLSETIKYFAADGSRISGIYHPRYDDMYDGVLRYIDHQIKRFIDRLVEIGCWDNTILIITGDHGEALGERGIYEHPWHYLFDELLKVPFLIRIPEEDGERVDRLFSLGWIHELIAEVIGIDPAPLPASTQSQSHLDGGNESRIVVSDSVSIQGYSAAVRDQEYKYIVHRGESLPDYIDEIGKQKAGYLFNHDRSESVPLKPNEVPKSLRDYIRDFYVHPSEIRSLEQELDKEAINRLSQLGYLSR